MALSLRVSSHILYAFISFVLLFPYAKPLSFNFTNFSQNIVFEGDAFTANRVLQLTKNFVSTDDLTDSIGRASYSRPVRIWDASNRRLADFTTHFSFIIRAINFSAYGDGMTFFMAPFDSTMPPNFSSGFLALFNPKATFNSSTNNIVAVEFDTFQNEWDPSEDHVGININSIVSVAYVNWNSSLKNGSIANAWVARR
ncbi:hypothetical protein COLO4_11699 [Corchorus olitorius]|uniref:Legume lectin domain-containing protein n=1 Tax=Corchorus olitorius TaxID=93759 RepID=A0A1R3K3K3_9ROSI|nr:hypothetical protein COLO4_11699 [Corchorus olitorius]